LNQIDHDSGGPIYTIDGYSNGQLTGKILGYVIRKTTDGTLYVPVDVVIDRHQVYPTTD
jgi:hypothetical protein